MFRQFSKKNNITGFSSSIRHCSGDAFEFLSKPVPLSTKTPKLPLKTKISNELIHFLEKISLVNFGDKKAIEIVEHAISYADQLQEVCTEGVEPLYTVLENEPLYLREDTVSNDVNTSDLLSHSVKIVEGYYVARTGSEKAVAEDLKVNSTWEPNLGSIKRVYKL